MSTLDSLPHPLSNSQLRALERADDIEEIPAGVVEWEDGYEVARAFVVETTTETVAIVEVADVGAYRVLVRGDDAFEQYRDWCDEHGYGEL